MKTTNRAAILAIVAALAGGERLTAREGRILSCLRTLHGGPPTEMDVNLGRVWMTNDGNPHRHNASNRRRAAKRAWKARRSGGST